jgi:predicted metalloprotease with PDZ domain
MYLTGGYSPEVRRKKAMKKWILGSMALALLVQAPALKAEEDEKCEHDATVCARDMAAALKKKGWMGITFDYDEEAGQVVLEEVFKGSPAEAAGLEAGDMLLVLNGIAYEDENKEALARAYKEMRPGGTMTYDIERDGQRLEIEVTIGEIPEYIVAQWVGKHMLEYHPAEEAAAEGD